MKFFGKVSYREIRTWKKEDGTESRYLPFTIEDINSNQSILLEIYVGEKLKALEKSGFKNGAFGTMTIGTQVQMSSKGNFYNSLYCQKWESVTENIAAVQEQIHEQMTSEPVKEEEKKGPMPF